ncbi:MAG TPA: Rid family detoxifying hydrolase [Candidatus Deferrimicrobium sp.]|nr:Rid family detoxifying hydrolase [Candidatus Deferrimicrobium sp.]
MTEKRQIATTEAPLPVGPYSQAIEARGIILTSGQMGINPSTARLAEGIENQTRQALRNVETILRTAHSTLDNAIKVTVFLKDITSFARMNEIYAEYFPKNPPARSCVEVNNLLDGAEVEIEVMATVDENG